MKFALIICNSREIASICALHVCELLSVLQMQVPNVPALLCLHTIYHLCRVSASNLLHILKSICALHAVSLFNYCMQVQMENLNAVTLLVLLPITVVLLQAF